MEVFYFSGENSAKYGDNLINDLAASINVKGISSTNLKLAHQFYFIFPQIGQTVSDKSTVIPKDVNGLSLIDDSNEELSISINRNTITEKVSGEGNPPAGRQVKP